MSRRVVAVVIVVIVVVAVGGAWFWWRHQGAGAAKPLAENAPPSASAVPRPTAVASSSVPTPTKSHREPAAEKSSASPDPAEDFGRIVTVDALGAPGGSIDGDLTMLVTLFEDWRTFSPGDGNPWGDNAEITAALLGKNRRHLVFIDKTHRAINADGELCDRWGTPFRFHALVGERMEIRSAGPDKKFGTPDDAMVTPP